MSFWRAKNVNSYKDQEGRGRHPVAVIVFGLSYVFGVLKVSTVTRMHTHENKHPPVLALERIGFGTFSFQVVAIKA